MKRTLLVLAALALYACGDEDMDDWHGDHDHEEIAVDEMDHALRLSWLDLKTRLFCPRLGSVSFSAWDRCRSGVSALGLSQAYLNLANYNPGLTVHAAFRPLNSHFR